MHTTAANWNSVKAHSAITVDVARNTNAGVITVATATRAATGSGRPWSRRAWRKVSAPVASIAAIDTDLSSQRLSGYCGTSQNTGASSRGKPGGTAGRMGATAELTNRYPSPCASAFASSTYQASSTTSPAVESRRAT